MPNASQAEIYFIAGMFVLILVLSAGASFFFFRTYKKEKAERQKRIEGEKAKSEN
jgi:flagellar basal body-associated protein FliL